MVASHRTRCKHGAFREPVLSMPCAASCCVLLQDRMVKAEAEYQSGLSKLR